MVEFKMLDPRMHIGMLGLLPEFLSELNPEPAKVQLDHNYSHGGGWSAMTGFRFDPKSRSLMYPGDPPMWPIAKATLREEEILIYPHAWVLVLQKDGAFEVARMD